MTSLHEIKAVNGEVLIKFREWDGIDRPDYTTVRVAPGVASQWGEILTRAATEAHTQAHDKLLASRTELLQKRETVAAELARLNREIEVSNAAIGDAPVVTSAP